MKILHVTEAIAPVGGCEKMLLDTCRLLQGVGHEASILVAADTNQADAPVAVHELPRSRGPRGARRLRPQLEALLDRLRPDIVHLHNIQSFLSPFQIKYLHKRGPTVRYIHDARLFCPRFQSKRLARSGRSCPYPMGAKCLVHCYPIETGPDTRLGLIDLGLRHMELTATRDLDAVLVGSAYMRDQLLMNGYRGETLHLLPGFTDKAQGESPPAVRPHILAVGRFDGIKGLEDLPSAFAALRTPQWTATLVGDGPRLETAHNRARALGLEARIAFPGRVGPAELDNLYRQAAVVVVPSRISEAFGLVGVEAMAHSRPVVAYDLGGVREWLQDGETGYLVAPGNEALLAVRIDGLLADSRLRGRMGATARKSVDARFRPETYLPRLVGIYRLAASARKSKG